MGVPEITRCQLALESMVLGGLEEVHFRILQKVREMTSM